MVILESTTLVGLAKACICGSHLNISSNPSEVHETIVATFFVKINYNVQVAQDNDGTKNQILSNIYFRGKLC